MRIAVLISGLLMAQVLVACTDEVRGEPDALPSPPPVSSTATPTSTATPHLEPAMPDLATGRTTAAVKAFIRYWVDVFNYSAATGDTAPLRRISSPHCNAC